MAENSSATAAAVFVHGIFGSAGSWSDLLERIREDPVVRCCYHLLVFSYDSPKYRWKPLRRIPDLGDVADQLATSLRTCDPIPSCERIVLLGHSQGGLVIQRFLADALSSGRSDQVRAVRAVLQFATPTTGSQLLLSVRRGAGWLGLWNNDQEKTLRPFSEEVEETRRFILQNVLYASQASELSQPIPFEAYVGASDGIVPAESARWMFPDTGTLPGDHFSIIKPDDAGAEVCRVVVRSLRRALHTVRSDAVAISTQAIDPRDPDELDAVIKLQGDAFLPSARVRREDLSRWLEEYQARFGIRLTLYVARIGREIVGYLMFHETSDKIVIDYVAVAGGEPGETLHGWPRHKLRSLVFPRMLARLRERAERLDMTVIFEVEDPLAADDRRERIQAHARIRLFAQHGARLVEGFRFPAPDMDDVPLPRTKSPYLLMLARPGKGDGAIDRSRLADIVDFLYLRWYRNWFSDAHDPSELDEYLGGLAEKVRATIPERCRLVTRRRPV